MNSAEKKKVLESKRVVEINPPGLVRVGEKEDHKYRYTKVFKTTNSSPSNISQEKTNASNYNDSNKKQSDLRKFPKEVESIDELLTTSRDSEKRRIPTENEVKKIKEEIEKRKKQEERFVNEEKGKEAVEKYRKYKNEKDWMYREQGREKKGLSYIVPPEKSGEKSILNHPTDSKEDINELQGASQENSIIRKGVKIRNPSFLERLFSKRKENKDLSKQRKKLTEKGKQLEKEKLDLNKAKSVEIARVRFRSRAEKSKAKQMWQNRQETEKSINKEMQEKMRELDNKYKEEIDTIKRIQKRERDKVEKIIQEGYRKKEEVEQEISEKRGKAEQEIEEKRREIDRIYAKEMNALMVKKQNEESKLRQEIEQKRQYLIKQIEDEVEENKPQIINAKKEKIRQKEVEAAERRREEEEERERDWDNNHPSFSLRDRHGRDIEVTQNIDNYKGTSEFEARGQHFRQTNSGKAEAYDENTDAWVEVDPEDLLSNRYKDHRTRKD